MSATSDKKTHPTIQDGWFHERSDMWPGEAMSLKVNEILHHEKSKFQDVLVFESSNHGTVLVLDNVIQCTERDEFSYQEMITHLAMNSHPNPKKVLVVGGGDGGVLREVVKHETVEEAILCDIDEAVIRISEKYLPSMAVGLKHPAVKTFIGDGFKFLADRQNEFDVIITDSSDPKGPAESLFQKGYFQLLHDALREGGVVATQGCTQSHTIIVTKPREFRRVHEFCRANTYVFEDLPLVFVIVTLGILTMLWSIGSWVFTWKVIQPVHDPYTAKQWVMLILFNGLGTVLVLVVSLQIVAMAIAERRNSRNQRVKAATHKGLYNWSTKSHKCPCLGVALPSAKHYTEEEAWKRLAFFS